MQRRAASHSVGRRTGFVECLSMISALPSRTSDCPCRGSDERRLLSPQGSMCQYHAAAISLLRARAARKLNLQVGLESSFHRFRRGGLLLRCERQRIGQDPGNSRAWFTSPMAGSAALAPRYMLHWHSAASSPLYHMLCLARAAGLRRCRHPRFTPSAASRLNAGRRGRQEQALVSPGPARSHTAGGTPRMRS